MGARKRQASEAAQPNQRRAGRDGDEHGAGIRRTSHFAFLAQAAGVLFTAVLTLYLVRALGPARYGTFALALSIGGFVLMPSDFGVTSSAQRFIAEHARNRDHGAAVFADALKLKLLISAAVCGALFALAGVIADAFHGAALAWPIRGIAVAVFAQSLLTLLAGAFVAVGHTRVTFLLYLAESAAETGFTIAFVILGAGATGAAFGRAAGYVFASLFGLIAIARRFGRPALELRWSRRTRMRQLAAYGRSLALVDTGNALFAGIDAVLIGALLKTSLVGFFSAPMRFVAMLNYPAYALAQAVAPRLAAPDARRQNRQLYQTVFRAVVVFQAVLIAPIVVWAAPIVHLLLGTKFGAAVGVLRLLAPYVYLSAPSVLITLSANYMGAARRRVPFSLGAFLINLLLDVVLLPRIGVKGAAIGTDAAYLFSVVGHLWICITLLELDLRLIILTFVRSLLAAAAMAGVLVLFDTRGLSPLGWTGAVLAGLLAFVAVLAVSREVTSADVRAIRSGGRVSVAGSASET